MSDHNQAEPQIVRAVTTIMAVVVGLTFLFGFGNVWHLALRLGVPGWVAPLVAPAVDLSVVGLLLGIHHLAAHGYTPEQLRPARRLLTFASVVTLALNTADPLIAGQFGKAAFDAVGPLLLIGWAETGPALLAAIAHTSALQTEAIAENESISSDAASAVRSREAVDGSDDKVERIDLRRRRPDDLVQQARQEDLQHWKEHRRPISAETLRKRLHVGARTSRDLVTIIRSDYGTGPEPTADRRGA
jgi:hypothetical protein